MEHLRIVRAGPTDVDLLQKIGKQTFAEAFSAANTAENMQQYLEEGFSRDKMAAALNDPESACFFAMLDNAVIGYLKLNFGQAQTELQDDSALEIERIYVLGAFQGKQVGQLLYEQAIRVARQAGAAYVWLGVWEENTRAIRFYQKNGFVAFGRHTFMLGNDAQTDFLMKLHLTKV